MFTLGVEEEFHVLDPETGELASDAEQVLSNDASNHLEAELQESVVETGTAVCETLDDVRRQLQRRRRQAAAAAESAGRLIAASGTHPFSDWRHIDVTRRKGYLRVEQQYQQVAREQMVCGCHVHVGIADRDDAVQVLNRARPWLPAILAVSGNSPFWLGDDSGYCSYRNRIWSRWPLAGIPDPFAGRAEYDTLVDFLLASGALDDHPRLYFDIRLSKKFDTVEVRIADVCMSVDEAVLVAALVRALLQTCHGQALRADPAPQVRRELLQMAVWRAARYGDCEDLLEPPGKAGERPRKVVDRLVDFVKPVLQSRGEDEEVAELLERIRARGTGAARQLSAYRRRGELGDVIDLIVSETTKGL